MVEKYCDIQFEVEVDGERRAPESVSPLFQADPFPGGHEYTCVISGSRLVKYLSYLDKSKSEVVSEDEASRLLSSLGLVWAEDQKAPVSYFLNSVEKIDFDGTQLRISGVCSPIIKHEA
jgi:hypothetical protein